MTLNGLAAFAAESETHHSGGVNPWVVGGLALGILLLLLVALLAFAGGREHS